MKTIRSILARPSAMSQFVDARRASRGRALGLTAVYDLMDEASELRFRAWVLGTNAPISNPTANMEEQWSLRAQAHVKTLRALEVQKEVEKKLGGLPPRIPSDLPSGHAVLNSWCEWATKGE